uniref:Uncharacterized protein n=1 Tax=Caenorhabditis japonica TaxID=281687 RepID=A0A8R1DVD8_CAEJA
MNFVPTLLRPKYMYQSRDSRARSSTGDVDDTFNHVYVPLLKMALNFSSIKYIVALIYCIRSMQEHLSLPTYCKDPNAKFSCSSSSCFWLHKVVLNLPHFMINGGLFVEQCAYLLVFCFISCSLFLYAVYLVKHESDLRIRYRAVLILPSLFFELVVCFLSYYATITSIFNYSQTATSNPEYFSSAFIIFAFIISIFYALLLVTHFATLYYIMIFPIIPLSIYAVSNTNYSALKYNGSVAGRSYNCKALQTPPIMNDVYCDMSVRNTWQQANETSGTVSSYSQLRSWNNTIRSTNTNARARDANRDGDDNEYLELI